MSPPTKSQISPHGRSILKLCNTYVKLIVVLHKIYQPDNPRSWPRLIDDKKKTTRLTTYIKKSSDPHNDALHATHDPFVRWVLPSRSNGDSSGCSDRRNRRRHFQVATTTATTRQWRYRVLHQRFSTPVRTCGCEVSGRWAQQQPTATGSTCCRQSRRGTWGARLVRRSVVVQSFHIFCKANDTSRCSSDFKTRSESPCQWVETCEKGNEATK